MNAPQATLGSWTEKTIGDVECERSKHLLAAAEVSSEGSIWNRAAGGLRGFERVGVQVNGHPATFILGLFWSAIEAVEVAATRIWATPVRPLRH